MNNHRGRIVAEGMLREQTPIENHMESYGLWVKREDLACPPPGPPFSKTRGVFFHVKQRPENLIGVLDTYHSQAGHAVARACQILGKQCINYYPEYKYEPGPRFPQARAAALGATLKGLPAGRSAVLFHQARKHCESSGGYMMPNALKLPETIQETAKEAKWLPEFSTVIIPASSATIACGVILGLGTRADRYLIHLGYSRSVDAVKTYLRKNGVDEEQLKRVQIIDEKYQYKDQARGTVKPPWPCNPYYDLKAFQWWLASKEDLPGAALFWNVG